MNRPDVAQPDDSVGRDRRSLPRQFLVYALALIGSAAYSFPFFWMVSTSLKASQNIFVEPPQWFPDPIVWRNYLEVFEIGPVVSWISNSAGITIVTVVASTVSSLIIAYGFVRFDFPGNRPLFLLMLSTLMLPGHVTIIPRFLMFRDWSWLDTFWPLIVPSFFGSAFAIFLLRQFMLTLPRELDEAAKIDGASSWSILWKIIVPLSKPALATIVVFTFIGTWNDFFEPFIYLTSPERLTFAVGMRWLTGRYGTQFHLLMASSTLSLLPVIVAFFLAQKQFIRGIALTGLKG